MKEALDVLEALGELEWARCVGSLEPLHPPFIAWRFKQPNDDLEARVVAAVRAYSGATKWTVSKGERNWVIEPTAFEQFAKSFRIDVEAMQRFGAEFPSDTRAALIDAGHLAEHLRKVLLSS